MKAKKPIPVPFPWFGGKRSTASEVWRRLGNIPNYVEPFAGGLGVLLNRPEADRYKLSVINDINGFVCNFFRAVKESPDEVARWACDPVTEQDLYARHSWLLARAPEVLDRMWHDPYYHDCQVAGWWCWGQSAWIGAGWCDVNELIHGQEDPGQAPAQRPRMTTAGIHRHGVPRPEMNHKGIHRLGSARHQPQRRPEIKAGGIHQAKLGDLKAYFADLADRLHSARVFCGPYERCLTDAVTAHMGMTGVFLDPPYEVGSGRQKRLYGADDYGAARACQDWAIKNAGHPLLRIALAGPDSLEMPEGWNPYRWKRNGMRRQDIEKIWFSPGCLP